METKEGSLQKFNDEKANQKSNESKSDTHNDYCCSSTYDSDKNRPEPEKLAPSKPKSK